MIKKYLLKNRSFRLYFVVDEQRNETTYNLLFKKIRFSSTFHFIPTYTHLLCLYIGIFLNYLYYGFKGFRGSDEVNIFWQSSFPRSLRARLRKNFPNSHFYIE